MRAARTSRPQSGKSGAHRGGVRTRDIGYAFDAVWARWVARADVALRPASCLEIYVNGGQRLPESERLTDLCVPVE